MCLSDLGIERFFIMENLYTLVISNGHTCPAPSEYSKIPVLVRYKSFFGHDLTLISTYTTTRHRLPLSITPSLIVPTVRHLEAVRNDKPDPVPWFQTFHLTANLLHHSCVQDRCHSHVNIHAYILSSGMPPKKVNVLRCKMSRTCSIPS